MASFEWNSVYVTGLGEVDSQHRRLVDIINQFGGILTGHEAASPQEVEQVFRELASYTEYHFHEEEGLMQGSGIDGRHVEQHKGEHAGFLAEVMRMHEGFSGEPEAAHSLLSFLTHWLAYHILGSDQIMSRQIAAVARGVPAGEAYRDSERHADPATATLLHALNGLFRQVSDRNRQLFELNQSLEAKVEERTRALQEANVRLEEMALTDALSGLPNRRSALRRFEVEWREAQRANLPLSCMMIDADGFKQINDTQGHDAGDEVIRRLSGELRNAVRTDDFVCRLGGDEFLVICPNTPFGGALKMAEALRQEVAAMRVPAGTGEWRGSISIGVASRTGAMDGFEALMRAADEGVYEAKRRGRNCVASLAQPETPS